MSIDELMIPYDQLEVSDETLGTGTFGVVKKGVFLGTPVALKIIRMEDINDAKEKAYKEVQIMRLVVTNEKGRGNLILVFINQQQYTSPSQHSPTDGDQ